MTRFRIIKIWENGVPRYAILQRRHLLFPFFPYYKMLDYSFSSLESAELFIKVELDFLK